MGIAIEITINERQPVAWIWIQNDGTGDEERANYNASLYAEKPTSLDTIPVKEIKIQGFQRKHGALSLAAEALETFEPTWAAEDL